MKYTFTIILSLLLIGSYAQNNPRYISKVFDDHNFYQNITYAEAIPYNTEGEKIKKPYKLDFYEPFGDDAVLRPLVILFPGGDFIIGNKEQDEIVKLCQELTTYGYTCACVNYRQGYDNTTPKEGLNQATFRAVQDGRSAIRFFIEHQEAFRINADKIFLGGYKTGAELALQTAFWDKEVTHPSNLECLDCSGNTFNHDVSVVGIININGVLNNKTTLAKKNEVAVLNIAINNSESKILQTADLADNAALSKNIENYHQYLVGLNVESYFESYEQETTTIQSFVNTINQNSIKGIVNFLGKNLISQTNKPLGDIEVCENTVETYYYPEDKESKYEWIIENGTIESRKNNTVNVRWNKGRGIGKIKAIKTNLKTGVQYKISEPLDIQITSAPIADFEMEYLSSNIIKIKDNSFGANLFSIDYDFEGQMYQGNPNTNVSFSYNKDGYYNLVQTVENICGFATQTIPVEISVPIKFKSTNIENTLEPMPALINQGDNIKLNLSTLSNSTTFNFVIRDDYNQLIKENSYIVKSMSKELLIETSNLKSGIYFIEFFTDEILVMTKRVRIK